MFNNLEEFKNKIDENDVFKFKVKAVPSSKIYNIDFSDELIKVKIKEPPIENKANKGIVKYLSEILKIPKSKIKILNGEKSSIKTVLISK